VHANFLYAGTVLMRINLSREASGTDLGLTRSDFKIGKWFVDVA
jgi:hypothetical protein